MFGKKFWAELAEHLDKAITLPDAKLRNTLAQQKKKKPDKEAKE